MVKAGDAETISGRYKEVLYRRDGFYPYEDDAGIFQARIIDIEPIGKLILEDETGRRREYMFKEVSYVL